MSHAEDLTDSLGNRKTKAKTVGKLIDNVVTLEGLFTIVIYTSVEKTKEGMQYSFLTQNDGSNTAKSPRGMFEEKEPNDLKHVISKMHEYYN